MQTVPQADVPSRRSRYSITYPSRDDEPFSSLTSPDCQVGRTNGFTVGASVQFIAIKIKDKYKTLSRFASVSCFLTLRLHKDYEEEQLQQYRQHRALLVVSD